ncbi:MAG: hypothetical protein LBP76_15005 [Treponema sp.]|jgi:hypothetical protein|nr:hypothetical protein [Treponema sp.]
MKLLWGYLHNHCGISYGFGSLVNNERIVHSLPVSSGTFTLAKKAS